MTRNFCLSSHGGEGDDGNGNGAGGVKSGVEVVVVDVTVVIDVVDVICVEVDLAEFCNRSRCTVAAAAAPKDPPTTARIKAEVTTMPITIFPTFLLENETPGCTGTPVSFASFDRWATGLGPAFGCDGCWAPSIKSPTS